MISGSRNGWDLVATIATIIELVMIGLYLGLIVSKAARSPSSLSSD